MFLSDLQQMINIDKLSNDTIVDFICKKAKNSGLDVYQDQFDNCVVTCLPKGDNIQSNQCDILGEVGIVVPLTNLEKNFTCKVMENVNRKNVKPQTVLNLGEKGTRNGGLSNNERYLILEDESPQISTLCKVALALNLMSDRVKVPVKFIFTPREEGKMLGATMIDCSKIKCNTFISLDGQTYNKIFSSNMDSSMFFCKIDMNKKFVAKEKGYKTFRLDISCQPKIERSLFGRRRISSSGNNEFSSLNSLARFLNDKEVFINSFAYTDKSRIECIFSTKYDELQLKAKLLKEYLSQKKSFGGLKVDCSRQTDNYLVLENSESFINFALDLEKIEKDNNISLLSFEGNKGEVILQLLTCGKQELEEKTKVVKNFAEKFGATATLISTTNQFDSADNASLIELVRNSYVGFEKVEVERGNFASELGIFQKKFKNSSCICLSPTVLDVGRYGERVEYSTVVNSYLWLKKLLCID